MIILALRVGGSAHTLLNGNLSFWSSDIAHSIDLPEAQSTQKIEQKRLLFKVVLEKKGTIEFDGQKVERQDWHSFLLASLDEQPGLILHLNVDRECNMENVYDLVSAAKEVGIENILFASKKNG